MYEINAGDFTNNLMMAYGDFNGDKYTDMVTVTSPTATNYQEIYIDLWSTTRGIFVKYRLDDAIRTCSGKIFNIIPGDIDFDGKLDIVVVTKKNDDSYCLDFFRNV